MKSRVGITALFTLVLTAGFVFVSTHYGSHNAVHAQSGPSYQGIVVDASGSSCTTGDTGTTCNVSWPTSFSSANYAVSCMSEAPAAANPGPAAIGISAKTASGFTVAGAFSYYLDCVAVATS
jgi:hypothetical protein